MLLLMKIVQAKITHSMIFVPFWKRASLDAAWAPSSDSTARVQDPRLEGRSAEGAPSMPTPRSLPPSYPPIRGLGKRLKLKKGNRAKCINGV